ncbi:hypothetical protein [Streptomyces sp. NPDC001250]|uniref:hypothetical protein n=1 Tax=unclassified Streptomyces TaxID=2593676 RepID=UPI003330DE16
MSAPISAIITWATVVLIPGIVISRSTWWRKGGDLPLDLFLQQHDARVRVADRADQDTDHETVVISEVARECLDQLVVLAAHGTAGQLTGAER